MRNVNPFESIRTLIPGRLLFLREGFHYVWSDIGVNPFGVPVQLLGQRSVCEHTYVIILAALISWEGERVLMIMDAKMQLGWTWSGYLLKAIGEDVLRTT